MPRLIAGERENIRAMQRAHRQAFARMDKLYWSSLAFLSQGGLRVTKPRGLGPRSVSVVLTLFTRALKTFRSVQFVCRVGDGPNAHVLVRSLFETLLAVHFILQRDTNRRSVMYLTYLSQQKLKTLNSWKTTPGLRRWWTTSRDAAVRKELADAERVLGADLVARLERHWSGTRSIEHAATKLNRPARRAYQILYRVSSRHAHPEDVADHAEFVKGEQWLKFDADPEMVGRALEVSGVLMWNIWKRMNDRFGAGWDTQIAQHAPPRKKPTASL